MRQLLDTNVLSEVTRPAPDPSVLEWLNTLDEDRTFLSGLASMDGLIAATAISQSLTLATRNIKDFEGLGIDLFNPWMR